MGGRGSQVAVYRIWAKVGLVFYESRCVAWLGAAIPRLRPRLEIQSAPDTVVFMSSLQSTPVLPDGVRLGNERLIRLTESAGRKTAALMAREKKGAYLRVRIMGGGCNGLSYKMGFTPEPKSGDILVQTSGIEVLVDSKSALYLRGTVLDYSDALVSGGFKFGNPNARSSCSCGESFSV